MKSLQSPVGNCKLQIMLKSCWNIVKHFQKKLDLGSCSVLRHKVNTAGAKPIRQPLRRTPLGFESEEKYLRDQIDNGVVQPSKSSWASPVCLVRKKMAL